MIASGLATGALIDYRDGDSVTAGVIVGEEKGRLIVVSEKGKEERLAPSRVALVVSVAPSARSGRPATAEACARASDHARRAEQQAGDVDLPILWELLLDEGEEHSLQRLASLALGREDGEARGAVLRALLANRTYFQRKEEAWVPRKREIVEEMLRQAAREREKARARERFVRRARAALADRESEMEAADEHELTLMRTMESLAVLGQNAAESRGWADLLGELGVKFSTPEEGAFRVCRALGLFTPDENLLMRRFGLPRDFPPDVREAARRAAQRLPELLASETGAIRRDLRNEAAFTIDDEGTVELDDALSVRCSEEGFLSVGIHIADPSSLISVGDPVDLEAEGRGTSHYLPDVRIAMIPPEISEEAASLVPDADRPALSFLIRFSQTGERLDWEVVPSVVRSRRRVSYDMVDALLDSLAGDGGDAFACKGPSVLDEEDGGLRAAIATLWRIAGLLEEERIAGGAVRIVAPEVEARPAPDGGVSLTRVDMHGPGRRLVAEMMVLAGRLAAEHCIERGIPALFRKQAAPEERVPLMDSGRYDPVAVRKARRAMRRGEVGTTPGPHAGLGLPAYVQATSPLRRYQDLVAHRQIAAQIGGRRVPYDIEALQRIAATSDETERQARLAEKGSTEYWILRYLETEVGRPAEAVVLDTNGRRTDVELSETLLQASIPARPSHVPGLRIRVLIERVVPRGGILALRETGQG